VKDIRDEKRIADENSRDAGLTTNEEMERVMKGTLDRLHREMDGRFARKVSIKQTDIYMMDKTNINFCSALTKVVKEFDSQVRQAQADQLQRNTTASSVATGSLYEHQGCD